MSGLREPAARPDRRETGRRARTAPRHHSPRHTAARPAPAGTARQIRPQLIRAAVLPTVAAGLIGAAAVLFTLQLDGRPDGRLWLVLAGCALLFAGALAAALLGAQRAARTVRDRCEALRRSSVRGQQELRSVLDRLERGESVPERRGAGPAPGPGPGADEFQVLAEELRQAREQAHAALVRTAGTAGPSDSDQKVEVFVNLARRLQSLVHREIQLLDGLEDTIEDPDLLKELFHVDHLATRIRRHAENLAVLGGAASRRQWTRPIGISEVLRSAVAEVEQYTRVKVVPPAGGGVRGHAVADVVHLLAELVENATVFSPPDTDVVLRAERVTAGIAIEVEDRGLGMPPEEQHRMNSLLVDPDRISVRHMLADGRIGLFVVSALARRHGIAVELKSNIYGGVLAVLVLPQDLLGEVPDQAPETVPFPTVAPIPAVRSATAPTTATAVSAPTGATGRTVATAATAAGTDQGPGPAPQPPAPRPPAPEAPAPPPPTTATRRPTTTGTGAGPALPPLEPAALRIPAPVRPPAPAHTPAHTPAWALVPRPAGPVATTAEPPDEDPARPPLPKRRAQQHLAPQLRDLPAAPVRRAAEEEEPVPDPGLMAAFRRGFGLAQAAAEESP
ncbi:ATP-binding protein [Streptomyces sp. NPDC089919]|uniref:sensor histidine kinase n=1 Tax=Streptomyces sp. NPDC089919 TaxID=3155188 RepID=UPI003440CD37